MSLRVAVVAHSDVAGGAESQLVRLYEGLRDRHDVDVTLVGGVPGWPSALGRVVRVDAGPKLTRRQPLLAQGRRAVDYLRRARRTARRLDVDVYHVQYFREKLVLPRPLSHRASVLWTEHGPLPEFPLGGIGLLRAQASHASVVAVSAGVAASLDAQRIASRTIWNPLPPVSTRDTRQPGEPVTVLYAGRLHAAKRVDLLLEAARAVPEVRVLIAGDGAERAALEATAPSNAVFVGHRADVAELIAAADAVVLPSGRAAREGSPMAVLEARAHGVPVLVADDCHAAAEALELGGEVFAPTPSALAAALAAIAPGADRAPVPDRIAAERTTEAWVDAHHALMVDLVLGRDGAGR